MGVATPQVPKYQAIHATLRRRILDGELVAGERLPAQQDLADSFGVTLMTLRQAMAALEADGLVRAERGRGTFVADRPIDIRVGNLSSFAQQMRSVGVEVLTEVLDSKTIDADDHAEAAAALECPGQLCAITRRRSVGGQPFSLQRSYLKLEIAPADPLNDLVEDSLYDTIEKTTGSLVAEARETITAVALEGADAVSLAVEPSHPALLSIRTSLDQFGRPFLYDEALLVAGRCVLSADRSERSLSLNYGISPSA